MTSQMAGQSDPMWRFPGNVRAIEGEIRRLDDVKERLWAAGHTLRSLSVDSWAGAAYDAFEEIRHRLALQWFTAGDSHADAARALEQYHATLLELRRRLTAAGLQTTSPFAVADMARWTEQLDSAAYTASVAIRAAAATLAELSGIFTADTRSPMRVEVSAAPEIAVAPASREWLDPRLATTDQPRFRRRVQELSNAVLAADYIAIPWTEGRGPRRPFSRAQG